jgi:hypothetical protein
MPDGDEVLAAGAVVTSDATSVDAGAKRKKAERPATSRPKTVMPA